MHREMEHQQNLDGFPIWQFFKEHKELCVYSVFRLAIIQNMILLIRETNIANPWFLRGEAGSYGGLHWLYSGLQVGVRITH